MGMIRLRRMRNYTEEIFYPILKISKFMIKGNSRITIDIIMIPTERLFSRDSQNRLIISAVRIKK
jgi:hypothetical protein